MTPPREYDDVIKDSVPELVKSLIRDGAVEVTITRQDDGNFTVKAAMPDEQGTPS